MDSKAQPIVFTPDNEPYLGRNLLFHFDKLICSVMEKNAGAAPLSFKKELNDHERMASQVIAQAISISLSIRELIRQGYLFGASVLIRALAERSAILLYIHYYPKEIDKWNRGWNVREAPSFAKMIDAIIHSQNLDTEICGKDVTKPLNSLIHGKPDSVLWNVVPLEENRIGHAVSKILNRPDLCDQLCADVIPWLAIIPAMMSRYFPKETAGGSGKRDKGSGDINTL